MYLKELIIQYSGEIKKFLPKSNKGSMFCNPTTCLEVFKIIQALKNNKSPEPDNLGPKIVELTL